MEVNKISMADYIQSLQEQGLINSLLKQSLLKHLRDNDSEVAKHAIDNYEPYDVKWDNGKPEYYQSKTNNRFGYAFGSAEEVELYDSICKLTKDEKMAIKIFAIVCKLAGVKTDWEL